MEKDIQKNELFKMYRQTGKSQTNFLYMLKNIKENCNMTYDAFVKFIKNCGFKE